MPEATRQTKARIMAALFVPNNLRRFAKRSGREKLTCMDSLTKAKEVVHSAFYIRNFGKKH